MLTVLSSPQDAVQWLARRMGAAVGVRDATGVQVAAGRTDATGATEGAGSTHEVRDVNGANGATHAAAAFAARSASGIGGTLRTDSRAVQPGDAFIAWPGQATDGRHHVPAALAAGAAACLVEADGAEPYGFDGPAVAGLRGLKAVTGAIADAWFGHPAHSLDIVASTGTNGKTSTAWWTAQALTALGRRCAVIGTLGAGEPPRTASDDTLGCSDNSSYSDSDSDDHRSGHGRDTGAFGTVQPTGLTTPDPVTLHRALRGCVDAGCSACALEASSIGLVEHRLAATRIDVALLTNFTRDHLDYHGSMAAYWAAKRSLFDGSGLRAAVVNVDDPQGAALAAELEHRGDLAVWTVSSRVGAAASLPAGSQAQAPADSQAALLATVSPNAHVQATPGRPSLQHRLQAQDIRYVEGGLAFTVVEGSVRADVRSVLVGDFNASNLVVVIGGLRALGVPLADAAAAMAALTPVPGRLQRVAGAPGAAPDIEVVVDYAHTPDALAKVLQSLQPLAAARGGRLWCVFGCGGNRDATKRPLMGAIAEAGADRVVVTSDNPRDEVPQAILSQIVAGFTAPGEAEVIADRRSAVAYAIGRAAAGDVVLLAGKGHEDYQELAGVKRPFSDVQEARAGLAARNPHRMTEGTATAGGTERIDGNFGTDGTDGTVDMGGNTR